MYQLVLIRHGQSQWNLENRFTGWVDVDISEQGQGEAEKGAFLLKKEGFSFDIAYTSVLKRAIRTLWILLDEMDLMWIPQINSWRLNERHYGALQGLDKVQTVEKHGKEQVHLWRRGYDTAPPPVSSEDPMYPGHDIRYKDLNPQEVPVGESLKLTVDRVVPFWHSDIAPAITSGKRVLVAAHGNSLRALVKFLDNVSDEEISELNIPTGIPLVYELDKELKPIRHYYLGNPEDIEKAIHGVANQTGVK